MVQRYIQECKFRKIRYCLRCHVLDIAFLPDAVIDSMDNAPYGATKGYFYEITTTRSIKYT